MAATTIFIALSLTTLLGGQNGQGASARETTNTTNSTTTPELQIGARMYGGPSATASSGTGEVVNGTVWIDASRCAVSGSSGASVSVRGAEPGPSAVRWTYTGHIVDRVAGGAVADIEWERNSVNYGDAPKSTKRVNLRVGESVVIDELVPKAPDNMCGASVMRLEVSLIVPARGFGSGGGAGAGGRGPMAAGGGLGASSSASSTIVRGPGGQGAGASAGGGAGGFGANATGAGAGLAFPQAGDDLRTRMLAMRDFMQLMAAVQGQSVIYGPGSTVSRNDLLAGMHPVQGVGYDAEAWLVHRPAGGQEETQRVEVHVDAEGQAFEFPVATITTSQGPAKVNVAAMLRPVANANGDIMLVIAIVRRIDGPNNSVTGGSTKIIPLPAPTDILSFELPDTHGTTFDALNGHQFSVRVRIAKK